MHAAPRTSFVIPARNAAPTLAQTLDSVMVQGDGDWEALIVDDGSTDGTPALIAAYALRDARFVALRGSGTEGVSGARNAGLHRARGRSVVFLDADDWIDSAYLQKMHAALDSAPDAVAAYCDWRRVMPDGALAPARSAPELAAAPFETFARTNAVATHAVLVKREHVLRAGGFDTALRTCEDWDLWQRVARLDGRWVHVATSLACYRTREGSLSRDLEQVLADASIVIDRGFATDPRLPGVDADPVAGAARLHGTPDVALAYFALWCAAGHAARGQVDGRVRALLGALPAGDDHATHVAVTLFDGVTVGLLAVPQRLAANWQAFGARVTALIDLLGAIWNDPAAARRTQYAFERLVLQHDDLAAPRCLSLTLGLRVDLRRPSVTEPPSGVDRLYAYLCDGDRILAIVEPGALGLWTPRQWIELAARRLGWKTVMDLARPALLRSLPHRIAPARLGDVARAAGRPLRRYLRHEVGLRPAINTALRESLIETATPADHHHGHAGVVERLYRQIEGQRESCDNAIQPMFETQPQRRLIPVLAYCHIADSGPHETARWRVGIEAFQAQLRWLRGNGYHTVVSDELARLLQHTHPVVGKPVMITFDGGHQDFADVAWPLLQSHRLHAEVFIATHLVSALAAGDRPPGEPAALMDEHTIAALAGEGVRFGSLFDAHHGADGMSTRDLALALLRARVALEQWAGRAPSAMAVASGSIDQRLQCLAAECGFHVSLTTASAPAAPFDAMSLPRIEVRGDMALQAFAAVLETPR